MLFDWLYGPKHGSSNIYRAVFEQCLRYPSRLIGFDIFGSNKFQLNVIGYVTLLADVFLLVCCGYTVVAFEDEALKCVCYASFAIMVIAKGFTLFFRRPYIMENIGVIRKIYASSASPAADHFDVVEQCSKYSLIITRYLFMQYLFCAVMLYPLPLIFYLLFGELELLSPVLIPGVNHHEPLGYAILYLSHCHSVFFGSVCFAVCDILFANSSLHTLLFSGMIRNKFERMNRMLAGQEWSVVDAKRGMLDIITLHLNSLRYMDNMDRIYFIDQTIQMACSTLCIVSLICSFFLVNWLPAYFLIITTTGQLFIFCMIGTIIEIAYDRMFYSATMSNWYLLPTKVQKDFQLLMLFIERTQIIKIAGIWPLNISTFVSIMRLIYSFAMMINKFLG